MLLDAADLGLTISPNLTLLPTRIATRCSLSSTMAEPAATEIARTPQVDINPKSASMLDTKVKSKYGIRNECSSRRLPPSADLHAAWIQKATKNASGTIPDEAAKNRKV